MGFLGFDSSPRGHNSTPSFHSVLNFIYIYICMNISSVFDGMEKKKKGFLIVQLSVLFVNQT